MPVWDGRRARPVGRIAHVVRNCARYGNLSILEDSYGINLRPLATFAQTAYAEDPCVGYALKGDPGLTPEEHRLNVQIQKAMAILQFKVEAQLIDEYPSFGLEDRKQLHTIKFSAETDENGNPREAPSKLAALNTPSPTPCSPRSIGPIPTSSRPEEEAVMESLAPSVHRLRKAPAPHALHARRGQSLHYL